MYYSPPKSSIWGHSLRKMLPGEQRQRAERFLAEVAPGSTFAIALLFFQPGKGGKLTRQEFEAHFTGLLSEEKPPPVFSNLNEKQFEICFQSLLDHPELYEPGRHGTAILASHSITQWRLDGEIVPTGSDLSLYFGAKPRVMPRFSFQTDRQFELLSRALEDAGLGKLNPKHIKGRRKA